MIRLQHKSNNKAVGMYGYFSKNLRVKSIFIARRGLEQTDKLSFSYGLKNLLTESNLIGSLTVCVLKLYTIN